MLGEFLPLAVVIFDKQLLLVVSDVPLGKSKGPGPKLPPVLAFDE